MSSDCQAFRDQIADVAAGLLPVSGIKGLQEHLDSCEDCRGYMQVLQEEECRLTDYFARLDSQNAQRQQRVLQTLEEPQVHRRTTIVSIGRTLMMNRYSKWGAVAAVFALVAASLIILDRSTAPAYALADLARQFEQARTIHVRGWHYFPEFTMPDGSAVPPSPIDNWTDVVNARVRFTTTYLTSGADGVKVGRSEVIHDGPSWIRIDHGDRRSASYFRVSEYQQKLGARRTSKLISGQLFGDITQLSSSVVVGTERVDGVACDIWQSDDAHGSRWKQWLSADTGRLARAQVLRKMKSGEWKVATDYSLIEYNVEPPEDTFAVKPPEGYTESNSLQTAYPMDLDVGGFSGWADANYDYKCGPKVAFALADGSIVLAWQSFEYRDKEKQAPFFDGVTFGGPLPKLPLEFYALKPAEGSSEPLYTGYHLAFTRKQGRFIEWSLYVPNGTPPTDVQASGYKMLYRYNLESVQRVTFNNMTVKPEFTIDTTTEFDEWVLGAMAELSDDGQAPAEVTYQKVTDLAGQLRTTTKP